MTDVPKGFQRATGTVEGRRHCLNPKCGLLYPVVNHDIEQTCPFCGHRATAAVRKNAAGGDAPRTPLRLVQ